MASRKHESDVDIFNTKKSFPRGTNALSERYSLKYRWGHRRKSGKQIIGLNKPRTSALLCTSCSSLLYQGPDQGKIPLLTLQPFSFVLYPHRKFLAGFRSVLYLGNYFKTHFSWVAAYSLFKLNTGKNYMSGHHSLGDSFKELDKDFHNLMGKKAQNPLW